MKRFTTALFAVLALAFIGLSPSKAQAAPITCSAPAVAGGLYPQGFLWACGSVSDTDIHSAITALSFLGGLNNPTGSDAKTKMSSANHYVYIFGTAAEYTTYCGQSNLTPTPVLPCPTIPSTQPGVTYPPQATVESSIIFANPANNLPGYTNVAQATAHEAGHQLDDIYGVSLYTTGSASQINREFATKLTGFAVTVGGTKHAGDVLKITIQPVGGSLVTISYTVVSADTLTTIATHLTSLINASSIHSSPYLGTATSSAAFISFKLNSSTILSYSTSVSTGATESLTLNMYDWPATNAVTPQCTGRGLFTDQLDQHAKFICGTVVTGPVGGTPTAGSVYKVTVTDTTAPTLVEPVVYTVPASPPPTQFSIAAGIIAKINADPALSARHITAQSGGGSYIEITSGTQQTTYVATVTGVGSLTLGSVTNGSGNTLSNSYSGTNSQVLQAAWSLGKFFSPVTEGSTINWIEIFADDTAEVSQQDEGGNQNPSAYYMNNGFICTLEYVKSVEQTGKAPGTAGGIPYNPGCK